ARFRIMELKRLSTHASRAVDAEIKIAHAVLVLLENISTADIRLIGHRRGQLLQSLPMPADLDRLKQHLDAVIIRRGQFASALVNENFGEAAPAGVMAHLLEQFVPEKVKHQRLLPIAAYFPIRIGGQAQERHALVVVIFIFDFNPVWHLRKAGRSLTVNFKVAQLDYLRGATQRAPAP